MITERNYRSFICYYWNYLPLCLSNSDYTVILVVTSLLHLLLPLQSSPIHMSFYVVALYQVTLWNVGRRQQDGDFFFSVQLCFQELMLLRICYAECVASEAHKSLIDNWWIQWMINLLFSSGRRERCVMWRRTGCPNQWYTTAMALLWKGDYRKGD